MIGLIAVGVVQRDFKQVLSNFWGNKAYVAITIIFFISLFGGLYSSDLEYLQERLRIKLPFLLLPLAFAGLPSFTKKQYHSIFYFLLVLMTLSGIGVLINYFMHSAEILDGIKQGRAMDTPINHIRFSLLAALGILAGFQLWSDDFVLKYKWERWLILLMTGFLFVFIHFLSVRSGLLALYAAIFVLIVRNILLERRYILGIFGLLGILLLPVLAFFFVPAFQAQVYLTRHDYRQYQEGKIGDYSFTQRMISYEMALKATSSNPIIGVGTGDLPTELHTAYQKHYPEIPTKLPHNQFLFFYVGTGILGLLVFLFCFLLPLFYRSNFRDGLFLVFHVVVLCSFMVEATIETAIGTAFYLFFVLLMLHYLSSRK